PYRPRDVADQALGFRGLFERRLLAAGEAGLEEAQLDPVGQAARGPQMRERVDVELQAVRGALRRALPIVHGAGLEIQDGDDTVLLDHEVVAALDAGAIDVE